MQRTERVRMDRRPAPRTDDGHPWERRFEPTSLTVVSPARVSTGREIWKCARRPSSSSETISLPNQGPSVTFQIKLPGNPSVARERPAEHLPYPAARELVEQEDSALDAVTHG